MAKDLEHKAKLAMKLLVEWRKMRKACHNRSECSGCPYERKHICNNLSTEDVLEKTADAFYEYLINNPLE